MCVKLLYYIQRLNTYITTINILYLKFLKIVNQLTTTKCKETILPKKWCYLLGNNYHVVFHDRFLLLKFMILLIIIMILPYICVKKPYHEISQDSCYLKGNTIFRELAQMLRILHIS